MHVLFGHLKRIGTRVLFIDYHDCKQRIQFSRHDHNFHCQRLRTSKTFRPATPLFASPCISINILSVFPCWTVTFIRIMQLQPRTSPKIPAQFSSNMVGEHGKEERSSFVWRGGSIVRFCQLVPVTASASHDLCVTMRNVNYLYMYISYYPDSPVLSSTTVWQLSDVVLENSEKEQNSQTLNCWRDPRHSKETLAKQLIGIRPASEI